MSRGLILITQVFHPDRQATSVLISQLAVALAERGHLIEVLAGRPGRAPEAPAQEVWRGVRIRRGGLRVDGKRNLFLRAMAYLSYSGWLAWQLCFRVPANAHLVVLTNPPFTPALVWLCGRLRGWTFDVYLHDVYPDGLVALGGMSPRSPVVWLWSALNRRALAKAQRVLVLGRDMAELCQRNYGVAEEKVLVVPSWSPVEFPRRVGAEETRLWQRVGRPGRFLVQYSGNMGLWHDLDGIIDAADQLRREFDIHFLLIGDGRRREAAEKRARQLGLTNLTWLPFQSEADLADSLQCCHAAIISQRAGLEGVAVPSKLYGILASGRAVLAAVPEKSEAARVVRENDCGVVLPPGDGAALAAAIRGMKNDADGAARMGERAAAANPTRWHAVRLFEETPP